MSLETKNQILNAFKAGEDDKEYERAEIILKTILNRLDAIVLVTILENGEIVFANGRCKEYLATLEKEGGQLRYETLHGKTEWSGGRLSHALEKAPEKAVEWDVYNPVNDRTFHMTAMLIQWPGIGKVLLEFGLEITDSVRQRKMLESILNGMEALISVITVETNEILFINDSVRKHYGIESDGVGQLCHQLLQGREEPCESCPYGELQQFPDRTYIWEHKESVKGRILRKTAKLIDWPGGKKAHLEYAIDVTEARKMEKDILRLELEVEKIYYDPLTEIYSRRYFEENIEWQISSVSRANGMFSMMMVDIDHFKKFNDTYGHIVGDHCLKIIAERLRNDIKEKEGFIARYGGEEFVVVLPYADEGDAHSIAEGMIQGVLACRIPHEKSSTSNYVTISIGVVTGHAKQGHNRDTYLMRADEMLYESKQSGRNRYTFTKL